MQSFRIYIKDGGLLGHKQADPDEFVALAVALVQLQSSRDGDSDERNCGGATSPA